LLLICGYSVREIITKAIFWDIFKELGTFTITGMLEKKGIMSTDPLRKKITSLVINKMGTLPNLYQLYLKTGKTLSLTTLNATDKIAVIMSPFTHGHVNSIDAVLYSMNIPFLFYQLLYEEKVHIDGALANPYPIEYFDNGDTDILGIFMTHATKNKNPYNQHNQYKQQESKKENIDVVTVDFCNKILKRLDDTACKKNTFFGRETTLDLNTALSMQEYISKIVDSILEQRYEVAKKNTSNKCVHVTIEVHTCEAFIYHIDIKEKVKMIVEGYNEGIVFVETMRLKGIDACKHNNTAHEKYVYPPYYQA
jgi:predicted acylesterase/phospholipase RssA